MRRRRFVHRAARVAPFIAVIALAGALVLRHEQPAPQSAPPPVQDFAQARDHMVDGQIRPNKVIELTPKYIQLAALKG